MPKKIGIIKILAIIDLAFLVFNFITNTTLWSNGGYILELIIGVAAMFVLFSINKMNIWYKIFSLAVVLGFIIRLFEVYFAVTLVSFLRSLHF
jgi:hypothetical protein